LLNRLFEAVDRFAAGAPQHDDMTVAALRFV
jgi:serine phosphatase RsbU (regulator of sigma subunit)